MATMTMIQALRSAMDVMLGRDAQVVVFGEDVGYFGGVFRCTEGLQKKYGGTPALPLGGRLHGADRDPHALWRRYLRRADAQPEP